VTPPAATVPVATRRHPDLTAIENILTSDPARALELAQQAETRIGTTPLDEERRWLVIRALVRLDRLGDARAAARDYLRRHPEGRLRSDVERYTGVRLRPTGPDAELE
jgi:hypothetical protein